MARLRPLVLVVLGSACAGAVLLAPSALASPSITFETPSVVDPIHTFGEPSVGVDFLGRVFASGPTGTGVQRSMWLASADAGRTFRPISSAPPTALAGTEDPPGGGDTDIAFDSRSTQYFTDLYALACNRSATTSDGGATVSQEILPGGCAGMPAADRPWLAVYDPPAGVERDSAYTGPTPLVYQAYNNLTSGEQWNKSNDGLTYTSASGTGHFGSDGYPAIDQQTGKVFQAAGQQQANKTYSLMLNIGTPDATGNLTFLDDPGQPGLIHIADGLPGSPDVLFSVVSMDSARNLYAVWAVDAPSAMAGQRQVFVAAASASTGWTKWTKPVQVSDGDPATGDAVNVFPWIQAGALQPAATSLAGAGRADAVWYGSNKVADPSSHSGQVWNVFMSQLVFPVDHHGAVTGKAPKTTLVKVSPHPNHYDDICLSGTGCVTSQGNRNLADFFEVKVDRTGAAEVIYDDTSNGLAQPGFTPNNNQSLDHAGAPVVTLARQSSGPGLFGSEVSGRSNAPVSGQYDRSGDALYPVIGGANQPGLDIVGDNIRVSGRTLNVTMRIADLTPTATAPLAAIPGTAFLQYVMRWQMGNTIYYAELEGTPGTVDSAGQFYAGQAQSADLCSVSACFPHDIIYPEAPAPGASQETGTVKCPATPSAKSPCQVHISVNLADVGNPSGKVLEEVGAYAFAASHPQAALSAPAGGNALAQADDVPLEVDGACCINARP